MFALTESAVSAIQKLAGRCDGAAGGLRIAGAAAGRDATADRATASARALRLTFEGAPSPGDRVHDADGARLFVAPGLAAYLDGKALDADINDAGEVCFSVALQPG